MKKKVKKKQRAANISIGEIVSLLTVILGLHYFWSYQYLSGYLEEFGVAYLPILSMEDLTFLLIKPNLKIFSLSQFGILWILVWLLFYPNIKWKTIVKFFKSIPEEFKKIKTQESSIKKITLYSIFTVVTIFSVLGIAKLIYDLYFMIQSIANLLFVLISFITPFVYIFWRERRRLVLFIHLCISILWIHLFTSNSLTKIKETVHETSKNSHIEFQYDDKMVRSSDSSICVFHGSLYVIMSNPERNLVDLYRTEDITHIKYINKKVK